MDITTACKKRFRAHPEEMLKYDRLKLLWSLDMTSYVQYMQKDVRVEKSHNIKLVHSCLILDNHSKCEMLLNQQ